MTEDHIFVDRFGDLISSVFRKSWDHTPRDNPHSALKHALSWSPFPTFIQMYRKYSML